MARTPGRHVRVAAVYVTERYRASGMLVID